jgi:hypothetical protein
MSDGSFVFQASNRPAIEFDRAGRFVALRYTVLDRLRNGEWDLVFDHEFNAGELRIRSAELRARGGARPVSVVRYAYRDGSLIGVEQQGVVE